MNAFERQVRASIYASLRDRSTPPSVRELSDALSATEDAVSSALRSLAAEHCIVLVPGIPIGKEAIWMAHPFSGIETDFVVRSGGRQWFANCVWDGLSILALFGDGSLDTHSPATGAASRLAAPSCAPDLEKAPRDSQRSPGASTRIV